MKVRGVCFYFYDNPMTPEAVYVAYAENGQLKGHEIIKTRFTSEIEKVMLEGYICSAGEVTSADTEKFLSHLKEYFKGSYFFASDIGEFEIDKI